MIKYPVSQPSMGQFERAFINECLDNNRITIGPMVDNFEKAFSEHLEIPHVITTTSGTTALHLALVTLGIGPGDEVLVPSLTFVATANAVHYTGARVVLVDVDPKTWCMDPADAAAKVTKRTKAILPVHVYGVPADLAALHELAGIHRLFLVEDAAEGLGGVYHGKKLGTWSNAGIFSFYGNKVLTTGEGGAVVTESADLAKRLRFLRGQALDPERRYYHPEIGFNYRMTDLQAAIGCGQLTHLARMLRRRADICELYRQRLCYHGFTPAVRPDTQHAPWLFTLQIDPSVSRDDVMARLAAKGIETRPAFVPMHRLPMYRRPESEFRNAGRVGDHALSLPTYPDLPFTAVDEICDAILPMLKELKV